MEGVTEEMKASGIIMVKAIKAAIDQDEIPELLRSCFICTGFPCAKTVSLKIGIPPPVTLCARQHAGAR